MNEDDPKKPELRVLTEDQGAQRLERPERNRPSELPVVFEHEEVEVLEPDRESRLHAKTFEPDVAEILDHEEVEMDSEDGWGGVRRKAAPLGWLVVAGILICGLATWAAVTVLKAQPELVEVDEEKKELAIDKIKEVKEVRKTLDGMRACVRGYLTSKSVDEKLKYVRHPERVKPMMEGYYQSHEMKVMDFRHFERIRSMGLDSLSFVFSQIELFDGKIHRLLLEQLEDGTFLVDWESDVCYLPVPWDEYVVGKHLKPVVMRVFIRRDTFYAYEFRDEALYECYQLTTRDSEDHVFGFVKKGSEVAMSINRFMKRIEEYRGQDREPLMLVLRFPENTRSKKCVWIDQLVAPRWTYVKPPEADE